MKKGLFITFEGIDGAGKSTQINMLKSYLESLGRKVIISREPGGTDIGNKIRGILLDKENTAMTPLAELMLYYADRAQHINEKILPALNSGICVISDRYFDSSYAYQRAGRGLDISILDTLTELVCKDAMPDVTFLLDITLESSEGRISSRGEERDRLELESLNFKAAVREGFLKQAELDPERIAVINAMRSPEEMFCDIKERLGKLL